MRLWPRRHLNSWNKFMSLMRLLSSGRSWVGLKETTRYRMTDPRAMPKFGTGRNPFCGTATKAEPARMPALPGSNSNYSVTEARTMQPVNPSDQASSASASPVQPGALRAEEGSRSSGSRFGEMISTLRNAAKQVTASVASFIKALRPRAAALLRKLTSLVPRRRSRPRTAAIASFARGALQGELSLDRIKVVRNDLSDVDLEVVRTSEKVAPAIAASTSPTVPQTGQTAWAPATPGLIGAGKT